MRSVRLLYLEELLHPDLDLATVKTNYFLTCIDYKADMFSWTTLFGDDQKNFGDPREQLLSPTNQNNLLSPTNQKNFGVETRA